MHTLQSFILWSIKDRLGKVNHLFTGDREGFPFMMTSTFFVLLIIFLYMGQALQSINPAAAILDIGVLSLLPLGLMSGLLRVYFSIWLQEILWEPFRYFKTQFIHHLNVLTSWQKCILYFSVFFLLLLAFLKTLAIIF